MKRFFSFSLFAPLFSLAFAFLLTLFPFHCSALTVTGNVLHGWASSFFFYATWPALVLALGWGVVATRKLVHSSCLRPLVWLPALALGSCTGYWIGLRLAALILPLGAAAVAAVSLAHYLERPETSMLSPRKQTLRFALIASVALLPFSCHIFENTSGGGDVSHYEDMAQSLLKYGTLNLREQCPQVAEAFDAMTPAQKAESTINHARMNEKGEIYSVHSFGFSVLACPFEKLFGEWGHYILRFLITLFAALGFRALSLALGVRPRYADTTSLLLAFSAPYLLYSLAYLPEGIGCTLAAWAFWCVVTQKDAKKRWTSTSICAISCALLPYFHIRFLPMAGILAGCFGIEGLFFLPEERWSRKILRLALFSLVCFLSWGGLYACHHYMYYFPVNGESVGAAYNYERVFLHHPVAMLAVILNGKSLGGLFPALFWFLPATIVALFSGGRKARYALYAFVATSMILLFCCSTIAALEGACMPGRYLLQALPIMLPFAVLALQEGSRLSRMWGLFLGVLPVLVSVFLVPRLEQEDLIFLTEGIRSLVCSFSAFWEPMPELLICSWQPWFLPGILFGVFLFLASFAFLLRWKIPAYLCVLAVLGSAFTCQKMKDRLVPSETTFAFAYHPTWTFFKAENRTNAPDVFSFFSPSPDPSSVRLRLTGKPTEKEQVWIETRPPRGIPHNFDGTCAVRIRGSVDRDSSLLMGLWQGSHERWLSEPFGTGPFDLTLCFPTTEGWGYSNVRLALQNNQGRATLNTFQLIPLNPYMLATLPPLPPETTWVRIPAEK